MTLDKKINKLLSRVIKITWADDHYISYKKCNPLNRQIDNCAKFETENENLNYVSRFSTKLKRPVYTFGKQ